MIRVTFTGYDLHRFIRAPGGRPLIGAIQSAVARHYDIPCLEMVSARRSRSVSRPRQIAMYLCRQLTTKSLPDIGRRFGNRDHTTVIHALRQIEKLRRQDPELDRDLTTLVHSLDAQ